MVTKPKNSNCDSSNSDSSDSSDSSSSNSSNSDSNLAPQQLMRCSRAAFCNSFDVFLYLLQIFMI